MTAVNFTGRLGDRAKGLKLHADQAKENQIGKIKRVKTRISRRPRPSYCMHVVNI